jgi:hypothetical protein
MSGRDLGSVKALGAFAALVEDFDLGGGSNAVEDVILCGVIKELGRGLACTTAGLAALRVVD